MTIKEQNGAAAVEFAFVLLPLILIAFIIVEGTLIFYNQHIITNASREGARAGVARTIMVDPNDPAQQILVPISDIVDAYCRNHLITFSDTNTSPVTSFPLGEPATDDDPSFPFNSDFTVRVSYEYRTLASNLLRVGPTIPLKAETTMKMQ